MTTTGLMYLLISQICALTKLALYLNGNYKKGIKRATLKLLKLVRVIKLRGGIRDFQCQYSY